MLSDLFQERIKKNMSKKRFLKTLKKELRSLNPSELQKNISYYDEIIADIMESGFSEEAALEKIGAPQKIAREILENTSPENIRKKDLPGRFLICASIIAIILSVISGIRQYLFMHDTISIIGGADGPTSIFLAGRIGAPRMWIVAVILVLITAVYKIFRMNKKGGVAKSSN